PKLPENAKEETQSALTPVHRLKDRIFVPQDTHISSIGELLLPFLLGAMQSCWLAAILIGLASAGLFESTDPLVPLWAPFVIMIGSLLLFHYLDLRTAKKPSSQGSADRKFASPGASLLILLLSLLSLFFVWQHIYARTAFIYDPNWLLALFNDI